MEFRKIFDIKASLTTSFPFAAVRSCPEGFLLYRDSNGISYIIKNKSLIYRDLSEARAGFEPADNGVADRGLTTWLSRHLMLYS